MPPAVAHTCGPMWRLDSVAHRRAWRVSVRVLSTLFWPSPDSRTRDDGLANREAFRWRFQKRTGESRRRASYSTTMSLPDTDTVPHHCKIAGRADTLFSDDAIALIHNASRGHPRAVNNLALHALTAAFAADHAIVDEKAARIAIAETAAD